MRMTSSTSQIPAQSTLAGLDLVLNIIMDSILEGLMMMMMMMRTKDLKVLYCWKMMQLECLNRMSVYIGKKISRNQVMLLKMQLVV
jgi:hypothetical protein